MAISTRALLVWLSTAILFLSTVAGAQESLQFEETVFEANGSPLYVLNARARVKNVGDEGYRGSTVRFYFRLDASEEWTLIGERPLPGVRPGDSVACDLLTSSEGLPIVDDQGEVRHCEYRMEIRYQDQVTAHEGEFHPACIHEH